MSGQNYEYWTLRNPIEKLPFTLQPLSLRKYRSLAQWGYYGLIAVALFVSTVREVSLIKKGENHDHNQWNKIQKPSK